MYSIDAYCSFRDSSICTGTMWRHLDSILSNMINTNGIGKQRRQYSPFPQDVFSQTGHLHPWQDEQAYEVAAGSCSVKQNQIEGLHRKDKRTGCRSILSQPLGAQDAPEVDSRLPTGGDGLCAGTDVGIVGA